MALRVIEPSARQVYRRLLRYVYPYLSGFIVAIVGMVVVAATEPLFAWLMKPLLDGSFVKRDPDIIKIIPFALLGVFILRGVASFLGEYWIAWVGRNVVRDLRQQLFEHLLKLPMRFYDNSSTGHLTAKMIYDVEQVARASSTAITIVVRDSLTVVGLLAYMFYVNWLLSLVYIVLAPIITLLAVLISRRFRRISRRIQRSMGNVAHISKEIVEGNRVVKVFGGEETEIRNFARANEYNATQRMKMIATAAVSVPFSQFLGAFAVAVIVFVATHDLLAEPMTAGTFMSFVAAAGFLLPPMKRISTINSAIQMGIAAAAGIFALLDEDTERDTGTQSLQRAKGALVFDHVNFTYNPDKGTVLRDVSFSVEPGQTVAIVGRSGSGKSTLVSLLPRFYEADSGRILLDGIDLRDIKLADLRRQIALVSQDITLFNDTIAHNIAYGSIGERGEEQLLAAARAAYALEFIEQMPEGMNTMVGEKGVLLSGGQKQRVAIARALLKNAPILILDEATSALDSESERAIQRALDTLMSGRTTLVIAHRLSTIEKADMILVMDNGRIIEQGRHGELLARNGAYAALHQMQFRSEEAAP